MKMIRGIFTLQQPNVNLSFQLKPVAPGQEGNFTFDAPYSTNSDGDFDFFVPIPESLGSKLFRPGGMSTEIQVAETRSNLTDTGHSLAYLLPTYGHTVVSDIDDVLRVSTIYQPKEGLQNLLTRPFYPWMNMAEVFARWASFPDTHFHYLTTAPKQMASTYMDFVFTKYPPGSYDGRIINATNIKATTSIRKFLLEKILETYPHRKFTLLGDSTNFDIMEDYPGLAKKYNDRVQCVLIRNVTSTDPGHRLPYNTKFFGGLDPKSYMFFRVPVGGPLYWFLLNGAHDIAVNTRSLLG
jgi:phosphatidate phosphatase APP1